MSMDKAGQIFREKALSKLSSPDQLDRVITVTTPLGWFALGTVGAVLLASLIWGFVGAGIDNWGHVGGLLGGLALGWAFCPRYRVRYEANLGQYTLADVPHRLRAWGLTLVWAALLVVSTAWGVLVRH